MNFEFIHIEITISHNITCNNILNIKQVIYLHYKASTSVRDGRVEHSLLSCFLMMKSDWTTCT